MTERLRCRLRRFWEIRSILGFRCPWTWMTLFPPFRGWDVGCLYCAYCEEAMKAGRCERQKEFRYDGKCGVLEKVAIVEEPSHD